MSPSYMPLEVLVLVKSYPNPSITYGETVCVAGITRDLKWVRLYPVHFRHLDRSQQFSKWQWVQARVTKSTRDYREETYVPDESSITPLDKLRDWNTRAAIVDDLLDPSVEQLQLSSRSLGVIRPAQVLGFGWERSTKRWTEAQRASMLNAGNTLFGATSVAPLEEVPWTFHYDFSCDGTCYHRLKIVDWEVFEAYRKWRKDPNAEPEVLRTRFREELVLERDLHFILGTPLRMDRFRTFLIVGLFYPPRQRQLQLPFDALGI